jgi:cytochrome c oxidase assembly factor CtaG
MIACAIAQLCWRFPVALFALACTVVAILRNARRQRRTGSTPTERQLWYLPACVVGFEGVGNLSFAMRCQFGLTSEQMVNDFLLSVSAMAVLMVVAVVVGTIGQSVASRTVRILPPPAAAASIASAVAALIFVVCLYARFGLRLVYTIAAIS